jgi:hypothetical protein
MVRRAPLIGLIAALTFLAGCSNNDQPATKPPNTITVIENVNTTSTPNTFIALDNDRIAALGWTMPHNSPYLVSYVRLKLALDAGEGDSIVVALFRDSGGFPATPVLAFNPPVLPPETGTPALTTFTPTTFYTMKGDSTYWLVVYNAGSGSAEWTVGTPIVQPSGIATFLGAKADAGIAPAPPTTPVTTYPQFSLVGVQQ